MNPHPNQLETPNGTEPPDAVEILRAWVNDGELQVTIRTGLINDPKEWGGILVDLMGYAIMALSEADIPNEQAIEGIMGGFEERLHSMLEFEEEPDDDSTE